MYYFTVFGYTLHLIFQKKKIKKYYYRITEKYDFEVVFGLGHKLKYQCLKIYREKRYSHKVTV